MAKTKEGAKSIVIVESPTKVRTISSFLPESFDVLSSMGHIVDLPKSKIGVDVKNGFVPEYRVIKGKEKIVKTIKTKARPVENIYIATDPDREGEAIGWHIKNLLEKEYNGKKFLRITFHEITHSAIEESFSRPGQIDLNLVNAQQARRVLDRVVGYMLSPFLWKKIVRGLSAGRVQSVALKFIVDREKKIQAFTSKKYYNIVAVLEKDGIQFQARLNTRIDDKDTAQKILEQVRSGRFIVDMVRKRLSLRKPPPPFITSSLQQEAFRNFRFVSSKTMLVAQKLYEGLDVGEGELTGLITYMRTDSFNISQKAQAQVLNYIKENIGENYAVDSPYKFKAKALAQQAHEAVRPTDVSRSPEKIAGFLDKPENSLYGLIWRRFVSSYMKPARIETLHVKINCAGHHFASIGARILFDGFMRVWGRQVKEELLPELSQGEELKLVKAEAEEAQTRPPARFNDASLVKVLEEKGIGRPSTYAPTIKTLIFRNYVRREKGVLVPTNLGIQVAEILEANFQGIIDENFTAEMEKKLDLVEEGKLPWQEVLREFYPEFSRAVEKANENVQRTVEYAGMKCELCGADMVIKWSRKGRFISCSNYPKCKNAKPLPTGVKCPECGGDLIERRNRKGQVFYGCSNYPKCRYTTSTLPSQE